MPKHVKNSLPRVAEARRIILRLFAAAHKTRAQLRVGSTMRLLAGVITARLILREGFQVDGEQGHFILQEGAPGGS